MQVLNESQLSTPPGTIDYEEGKNETIKLLVFPKPNPNFKARGDSLLFPILLYKQSSENKFPALSTALTSFLLHREESYLKYVQASLIMPMSYIEMAQKPRVFLS